VQGGGGGSAACRSEHRGRALGGTAREEGSHREASIRAQVARAQKEAGRGPGRGLEREDIKTDALCRLEPEAGGAHLSRSMTLEARR